MMWQALGTCGEPCGVGVGSLEGKLVEAKWDVEDFWSDEPNLTYNSMQTSSEPTMTEPNTSRQRVILVAVG